jgi:hypothetical protein
MAKELKEMSRAELEAECGCAAIRSEYPRLLKKIEELEAEVAELKKKKGGGSWQSRTKSSQ